MGTVSPGGRNCTVRQQALQIILDLADPVAEFSASISSTPKFICSSDDGVPRSLDRENTFL